MATLLRLCVLALCAASTFAARCDPAPTGLNVCVVNHPVPSNYGDTYGDSVVFNTLSNYPDTSKDCAQAYSDYTCSSMYPVCKLNSNGMYAAGNACRSDCSNFVSKCQGQLSGMARPDCNALSDSGCNTAPSSQLGGFYSEPQTLSGGSIAGIVIGAIVFVAIVVVLVIFLVVRRRRSGGSSSTPKEPKPKAEKKPNKKKEQDLEAGRREEEPYLTVAVGGRSTEMNEMPSSPPTAKAKAPVSPSPRASVTLTSDDTKDKGKGKDEKPPRGSVNIGTGGSARASRSSGMSEKDAKIKAQLDALPEHHRKPPHPWGIYYTDDGDLYYWNSETDESAWEWPLPE
eukprot:TRINITY_DN157_c0_g1_i1.p1 TRINITY_DN157_c0_g1~~TRINITY_DN157_c0_g1_i1.p1  ORF type:complete len:342 (-),score=68.67 TRINITY_DN157_c0_g1_i1:63-1088(-)